MWSYRGWSFQAWELSGCIAHGRRLGLEGGHRRHFFNGQSFHQNFREIGGLYKHEARYLTHKTEDSIGGRVPLVCWVGGHRIVVHLELFLVDFYFFCYCCIAWRRGVFVMPLSFEQIPKQWDLNNGVNLEAQVLMQIIILYWKMKPQRFKPWFHMLSQRYIEAP